MNADPPTISYRGASELSTDPVPEEPGASKNGSRLTQFGQIINQVFAVFTWIVLFVVLLIWAVMGALFWIPLMIRALLRFCISLIEAMFEGHKPARAARGLRDAVGFYRRGFVTAVEVVTREQIEEDQEGPVKENRLLLEFLWAALVWYLIFLLFGWIQASPMDLVDWFLSIPWGEHFSDLISRFRT